MTDRFGKIKKGEHLSRKTEFKKGQRFSPKTEFKKGNVPFKAPVDAGTEVIMSGDIRAKLTNGKWGFKKRLVYEFYDSSLNNDDRIVFLDGDKMNCQINNLYKVSRGELAVLNNQKLLTVDRDLTLCGILYVKILQKCKRIEKEQKR
ncbi:HNH endonuclease [Leuconostoc mesenteroides]|uniref:HNH endonuclease n=1 Tax=Leuconostoc mesenteroides TaxID=1245 RepID=UPI00068F4A44|nr:HNH endonuclease [Leuconostoc mesenteroides]